MPAGLVAAAYFLAVIVAIPLLLLAGIIYVLAYVLAMAIGRRRGRRTR